MAIRRYLAMTAAENAQYGKLPEKAAWMYCPFSKKAFLPPESGLLVLTDSNPVNSHCAGNLINEILCGNWEAVLLDFQRPNQKEAISFAKELLHALPCPVAVSELYAGNLNCPVFLSPVPLHKRLADHIRSWTGRDIWLDISAGGERITVTEHGSSFADLTHLTGLEAGFKEENLHCHYSISLTDTAAEFTLWRTKEDLEDLLKEAENCSIKAIVGLYQEMEEYFL